MTNNEMLYQRAIVSLNAGNFVDAERSFRSFLQSQPEHIGALNLLVVILIAMERYGEAEEFIRTAVRIDQNSDVSFYNYGLILKKLGRPREALEKFSFALRLKPDVSETWNNRGTIFNDLREYQSAISDFDKAIALNQNYADAYANKGKSLSLLKRHNDALAAYDKALALKPDLAEAWLVRGNIFAELKRYDEAFSVYDKALALKPDLAEAWLGRGTIFAELKRYDEAFSAYDKALALKPDLAEAWLGRGAIFAQLKRYDEAFSAYDKALALKPDADIAEGARLHSKMHLCDWTNFTVECAHLISSVQDNKANIDPFAFLAISTSSEDQIKCAKLWANKRFPRSDKAFWHGEIYKHKKIRIAYVSGDFHQHAVAYLIAGVFECHDKSRFEVTAVSTGPDDTSEMRQRLKGSFDQFTDARTFSDDEIASRIRGAEIDILIDLKGFTKDARTGVFARRPAPIQVNYLGYPGTMGADYIDYLVADQTVVRKSCEANYTEKIVCLPNSYQANDTKRTISSRLFTRADFKIPEKGFVFCCFNNTYKIIPEVFDCWMRILHQINDSVLWLLEGNAIATSNLRKEAVARGISADRLVFAPHMPPPDHLARHRLADLFLDTLPYNAHTTASDALWAGLPVLTQIGETFAGRVAASLLNAIELPELITSTRQEYAELAIELAKNPEKLAAIKHRLSQNRLTKPLFNTQLFTRHIEQAYQAMYERYQADLSPENIYVSR
jgi:predicted O-linked N-acetylglucosamine transferase (SPINDLY family)